jgi:hypothetical protein
LPSRLRLKPPTPNLTFGGIGGAGRQFESVFEGEFEIDCARHEVRLKTRRKAIQLARTINRGIENFLSQPGLTVRCRILEIA